MEKYRILKNLFFSVFASKITNKFVFRRDYIHKYTRPGYMPVLSHTFCTQGTTLKFLTFSSELSTISTSLMPACYVQYPLLPY